MNSLLISGINELFSELVVHTRGGTIVFADDIQNECLSWNASFEGLLNNGAVTVMDLNNQPSWIELESLYHLFELKKNQRRLKITKEEKPKDDDDDDDDEFEKWDDEDDEDENNVPEEEQPKYKIEEIKEKIVPFTSKPTKALFFVASLSPKNEQAIKKAIHKFTLDNVVILCGQSDQYAQFHQTNIDQHFLTFSDLTERISFWCKEAQMLNSKNDFNEAFEPTVSVKHFLVNYATISPNTFTFPCLHDVFPHLVHPTDHSHTHHEHSRQQSEILPSKKDLQYKCVAHALRDMFCLLELDVEVHSMGSASHAVADHLMEVFKQETFNTSKNASLFLIDRTLDLATPTAHSENYFDRTQSQLERSDDHSVNVTTPTNPIIQNLMKKNVCASNGSTNNSFAVQSLGILHHMHLNLLESMSSITSDTPNDTLKSLLTMVEPNIKTPSFIPEKRYQKSIDANTKLSEEWQLAGCIRETSQDKQLSSMEKILMMDASVNESSLLEKITEELSRRKDELELTDVIRLLIFVYSLTSPNCNFKDVKRLKQLMVDITLSVPQSTPWLTSELEDLLLAHFQSKTVTPTTPREEDSDDENWDTWDEEEEEDQDQFKIKNTRKNQDQSRHLQSHVEKRINYIFDQLLKVNEQRLTLNTFDKILGNLKTIDGNNPDLTSGIISSETTYQSIMKQLLTQLDNSQKSQSLSDIRHSTSLIKSFAKFTVGSLFGGGSKLAHSRPLVRSDTNVVIIFVVGGLTGAEIRDARQVMENVTGDLKDKVLLLGGTRFATPDFVMRKCCFE
ncbi:MIP3 [Acrasis kona]|uniref:MIP3 n=1 Tax=Acrasis kona TaxID=1008807 RepID=A0AAW2ZPW1_9EUKA